VLRNLKRFKHGKNEYYIIDKSPAGINTCRAFSFKISDEY